MTEMTIDDFFERLEVRDSRRMGEKERILELIPNQRKIEYRYERVVNMIEDNKQFSMLKISRENGISDTKLKKYLIEWCAANDRELVVVQGGRKGSIIKLLD